MAEELKLFDNLRALLDTPEPADLGPGPRAGVQLAPALDLQVSDAFRNEDGPKQNLTLARALVLLWQDHLDDAHRLAQDIASVDGSYVHGIMHRREPDYSNAKYWFHRVRWHPCFPELARGTEGLGRNRGMEKLAGQLARDGEWNPMAFIDACERAAARPPEDPEASFLRAVQRLEFEILLRYFCRGTIEPSAKSR